MNEETAYYTGMYWLTTGELYTDRDVGYIIEDSKYHFSSWNLSFRKETGGVVSYRNVEDKYR